MAGKQAWLWALVSVGLMGGWAAFAAEEAKPQDIRPDIAKFKGFLAGEIVSASDTGLVLKIKSVTMVEGSQAANPGVLLGRDVPIQFAMEKDKDGQEKPAKWLADAVKAIQKSKWLGRFGALGTPGEMIITDAGAGGQAGGAMVVMQGTGVAVTAGGQGGQGVPQVQGKISIGGPDGAQIEVPLPGVGPGDDEDAGRPGDKGQKQEAKDVPRLLVRVQADDKGTLVLDRVMPGAPTGHDWRAIPKVRLVTPKVLQPAAPPKPPATGF
jgi:hypothetical protein